jgi:CRP/FNR family transcriptional regulator
VPCAGASPAAGQSSPRQSDNGKDGNGGNDGKDGKVSKVSKVSKDSKDLNARDNRKNPKDLKNNRADNHGHGHDRGPAPARDAVKKDRARLALKNSLFQDLPPELLAELASISETRSVAGGTVVFRQGDPARGFHLVAQGLVKIYNLLPSGKERILRLCGPGSVFGEAALFTPGGCPAFAEALEDSEIVLLPGGALQNLLESRGGLALAVIAMLAKMVNHFREIAVSASLGPLGRLAGYLLTLPRDDGQGVRLPARRTQLALLLGTTPEGLSRAMRKLKDEGLVEETGGRLVIVSETKMRALADGEAG